MKRAMLALLSASLLGLFVAAPASAAFGLSDIDVTFTESDGVAPLRAGSHPLAMETSFEVNATEFEGVEVVDGAIRNLNIIAPSGFAGNPTAVPRCAATEFLEKSFEDASECADSTALGVVEGELANGLGIKGSFGPTPVYNLFPGPGVAAKLGFWVSDVPVTINASASSTAPYNIIVSLPNTSQVLEVFNTRTVIWGDPSDPVHDIERGVCAVNVVTTSCPANIPPRPFITLPRSCDGPLLTTFEATSWWTGNPFSPGPPASFKETVPTADSMHDCPALDFGPAMEVQPSTERAESASGLTIDFDIDDEGIIAPKGRADSDIRKAVLTLPEGMTLNPSAAEGLQTCSPGQLEGETPTSPPGAGCPQAAKVGTVEVETPILEDKLLRGSLFLATQDDPQTTEPGAENPFDSLIALYIVIKDADLGVVFKIPGKAEPDPVTGQIKTIFDDLPPYPIGHFRARLREGGRSPLISPPVCGTHTTVAELTPSANPANPLTVTADFQINAGVNGGPCPPVGGRLPFAPGFQAGSINNNAGSHTAFHMRLTRRDGDQALTRFDATLPPGLSAKLAGVTKCSDADIASAKLKTGRSELAAPSCPASSFLGTATGGAGVGSQLTYVSGRLYLAGPVGGAPLSVVGIVPAVAGPFDVGTVVVRQALRVNSRTAQVTVDGSVSDPIPSILAGIPLRVRDVRVDVDRPEFTLNPTSCDPFATVAQIWGVAPVSIPSRFQAANCSRLGFKPKFSLRLKGGTKRGDHPALRAVVSPRPGDANLKRTVVRLPRSAFLDQAHIRTICTRVQFAADACPAGSIYGHVKAFTPILEEPFEGPAYLRSSDNDLPDLVLDLHGLIDVEAIATIDSHKGGIRATFNNIPDAPISKVIFDQRGGKRGLIVNSRNLCARVSRATIDLTAHSGKKLQQKPKVRPTGCSKKRNKKRR